VLSESSLFVYSRKIVLKTCGTTLLLAAVPTILEQAAGLGLQACRCKYSRASFLFPEHQVVHPDVLQLLQTLMAQVCAIGVKEAPAWKGPPLVDKGGTLGEAGRALCSCQ
jgi:Adenosylmethionine decarboxylase